MPFAPTIPSASFPAPDEFQQANAAYARTSVGEEELRAFRDMRVSGQPPSAQVAPSKPVAYDRSDSSTSDSGPDIPEDEGPPRPEEFGGMLPVKKVQCHVI